MVVHGIPGSYRIDDGDLLSVGRRRDARRLRRGLRPTPSPSARCPRAAAPPRGRPGCPRSRDRAVRAPATAIRRHLRAIQQATEDAGFAVVRELVGPRGGAVHARGAADPELRRAGSRSAPPTGDDARHRADDHRAAGPASTPGTTAGRSTTRDDSLAAHFEHTVAVTDERPRILTAAGVRVSRRVLDAFWSRLTVAAGPCLSRGLPRPSHESQSIRQTDV